jgi:hypothetical protein
MALFNLEMVDQLVLSTMKKPLARGTMEMLALIVNELRRLLCKKDKRKPLTLQNKDEFTAVEF